MLADSRDVVAYYDGVVAAGADPKVAANWVMGDIMAHLKQEKASITDIRLTATGLAELLALIAEGAISGKVCAGILFVLLYASALMFEPRNADCQRHAANPSSGRRQPPCSCRGQRLAADLRHQCS